MIKNNKKFIIKLLFVILWLGVIFYFSNANSNETTNHSIGVTKTIVTYSVKVLNSIHVTNVDMSEENINTIINSLHPYIRKIAHFTEYFILSFLVLLMIKETNLNYFYTFTILFCLFMAIFDESHQLFVEGRSGNYKDILIDTSGIFIYLGMNKIYHLIDKE